MLYRIFRRNDTEIEYLQDYSISARTITIDYNSMKENALIFDGKFEMPEKVFDKLDLFGENIEFEPLSEYEISILNKE